MKLAVKATRLGLRNSTTRLPFRYGSACLVHCPQAVLETTIELDGRTQVGYSGDCLPPGWFDKSPEKDYEQQIGEMLAVIAFSEKTFRQAMSEPAEFFPVWLEAGAQIQSWAIEQDMTPLLASFGASMLERSIIDAVARAEQISFGRLMRENRLEIQPGAVHKELSPFTLAQWLPVNSANSVWVRHSIGLSDPLTSGEITPTDRLNDGFPQALEEYLVQTGIRYLKIKVSNQLDHDVDRILQIAALVERHRGNDYAVTLDGNEQYHHAEQFDELIDTLRAEEKLAALLENTLVVEQPLSRDIALEPDHTAGIRRLSQSIPVIIDESDGTTDAYERAIELGYRGVSSKNCKGPIRSLLNMGLTWLKNDQGRENNYVMTGEDLCSVGVVPVQADLCLAATLGITHVERNGHHYHPGLSYLSSAEQEAALAEHGDFYARKHGRVAPNVVEGRFQIDSLNGVGFGFAALPDMTQTTPADEWDYAALGN